MERKTWREHSATICEIITNSDAARVSLVNKLCAAGLVAEDVRIQIHKQDAMTGANTLMDELSTSIVVREAKFQKIISVMADVEQLKEVVEDMRHSIMAVLGMYYMYTRVCNSL